VQFKKDQSDNQFSFNNWHVYKALFDVFKGMKVCRHFRELLILILPLKLSSAKFLACFNFQSTSMLLKVDTHVVRVTNSLDLGGTPSYTASHPDPSCLHMGL